MVYEPYNRKYGYMGLIWNFHSYGAENPVISAPFIFSVGNQLRSMKTVLHLFGKIRMRATNDGVPGMINK